MKLKNILMEAQRPPIYKKGTAVMWTDEYISKQLLQIHLNGDVDSASRKTATIEKTVSWILTSLSPGKKKILDLGCGPGLYCERYFSAGHDVTGLDFSRNSINYAKNKSLKENLEISYINKNYLELDFTEQFDLVTLIYTDFGVLLPEDQELLLKKIYRALKPGGIFIFDVLNEKNIDKKISNRSWDISEGGFWRDTPYLSLSDSFLYEKENVILYQHIVITENNTSEVYRFWTHYFSEEKISNMLKNAGFKNTSHHYDVLPMEDQWNGKDITFCKTTK